MIYYKIKNDYAFDDYFKAIQLIPETKKLGMPTYAYDSVRDWKLRKTKTHRITQLLNDLSKSGIPHKVNYGPEFVTITSS